MFKLNSLFSISRVINTLLWWDQWKVDPFIIPLFFSPPQQKYYLIFSNPFLPFPLHHLLDLPPPLPLSCTFTVHLRNPAFSAVQWCPMPTQFSLCHLRLFLRLLVAPFAPQPLSSNTASSFGEGWVRGSVGWISGLSKFGHAWQTSPAPAGWTDGLSSSSWDPYIKLHWSLGIPVSLHAKSLFNL